MRGTLTSATEIRRPPQFGPERFGAVGKDLEVILLVEGERQRERDLVGALEAGMGVQRVGEFVGGPYVVGENSMPRGPCRVLVRSKRAAAYARYFPICSRDAESVGMTTRPCDTLARFGWGWLARNASMFSP